MERATVRSSARRALVAVLLGVLIGVIGGVSLIGASPSGPPPNDQVCPGLDSGKIDTPTSPTSVEVEAPEGQVIDEYCVKSGSANQGCGPMFVEVDPPQEKVTITYPDVAGCGDEISHYSVSYTTPPAPATVPPTAAPEAAGQPAPAPAPQAAPGEAGAPQPVVGAQPTVTG
jgi:hypothetical protein